MNPNERQRLLTIVALFCFGALVCDKLVVTPLWGLWNERAERIVELERALDKGAVLVDREQSLRERWDDMRQNSLPVQLPVAEDQVLKSVDRWVQQSSLVLTSFKPEWRQNEEGYALLECRAAGAGTLESISRFLFELERSPLALKIDEIDLSARDEQGKILGMGLTFSGLLLVEEE